MGFVNLEKLNDAIIGTEKVWEELELDSEERRFLIRQLLLRIEKRGQAQQMSDLMNEQMDKGMFKGLMRRFMKGGDEHAE